MLLSFGDKIIHDIKWLLYIRRAISGVRCIRRAKGSSLLFEGQVVGGPTAQIYEYAINVGKVADDTAATMAAAANKVYQVADVGYNMTNLQERGPEGITFFGQDPNGNTVVYGWWNSVMTGQADTNANHLVDAGEFSSALVLIGVPSSSLIGANFVH